ncbi:MAG: hypothetical protein LBB25_02880 [Holosporaceae bacterium]|nr:hypothetical protein [Holosporaceae bacterium]
MIDLIKIIKNAFYKMKHNLTKMLRGRKNNSRWSGNYTPSGNQEEKKVAEKNHPVSKYLFKFIFCCENLKVFGSKGAILIEFAVAVPILFILIYYMHDAPKYARMQERMEFVANEMISIIQNTSKNRIDKKITKNDLKNALVGAYLSVYPGMTMRGTANLVMPLGHFPHAFIYYVNGLGNGNAKVVWMVVSYLDDVYVSCVKYKPPQQHSGSSIKVSQNCPSSQIFKDLRIEKGEFKIILECCHYYVSEYMFSDGRRNEDVTPREAFGFYILNPRSTVNSNFFTTVVVFTPKPGLFDESPPID